MQTMNFTEGDILKPLLRFAIPVLAALLLQTMYGAVDLLVVGQFSSVSAVSAVSTGSQMMQLATMLVSGLAMGTTILISRKIGERRSDEIGQVVGNSILILLALALILTVLMVGFAHPLALLMQAPKEALKETEDYVRICSGGLFLIIAYNGLGALFRGLGDSKTPLYAVFVACIGNIALDFIFVALFHLGASGAALATVLAQGLSVVLCLIRIQRQGLPFSFERKDLKFKKELVVSLLNLGTPIALQDSLVSLSFLVIIAIVNTLGVVPSAGVGVAEKLCGFIMLVPSAFSQSLSAFVAQNIGAKRKDRARKGLLCGMGCSFAIGVIMSYLSFFHGDLLSMLFARDGAVIAASAQYLKAYAIDTLLVSFLFCYTGYFSGCGRTRLVMLQGIAGAFLVRIPVSWLMSQVRPASVFLIGLATPCSTAVQIAIFLISDVIISAKEKRDLSVTVSEKC